MANIFDILSKPIASTVGSSKASPFPSATQTTTPAYIPKAAAAASLPKAPAPVTLPKPKTDLLSLVSKPIKEVVQTPALPMSKTQPAAVAAAIPQKPDLLTSLISKPIASVVNTSPLPAAPGLSKQQVDSIIASGGSVIGPKKDSVTFAELPVKERLKISAGEVFPKTQELTKAQQEGNININIPLTGRSASIPNPLADKMVTGGKPRINQAFNIAANIPSTIIQAVPAALVTLKNEATSFGGAEKKELGPVEAALYGRPEYVNVNQDIQDRIARGDGILSAYIGGISQKALDVAFGAQMAALGFRSLAKVLAPKDQIAQIEAWKTLGSPRTQAELDANFRRLAQQFHPDLTGGSDETIKVINQARQILAEQGIPKASSVTKEVMSRYLEAVGRETNLGAGILKPDLATKPITQPKPLNAPQIEAPKVELGKPTTVPAEKLKSAEYYPTMKKDLPLSDSEFVSISKENPQLVQMVKDGKAPPIPVRELPGGIFEPNGDGATRLIIYKHLGIKDVPIVLTETLDGKTAAAITQAIKPPAVAAPQVTSIIPATAAKAIAPLAESAAPAAAETIVRTPAIETPRPVIRPEVPTFAKKAPAGVETTRTAEVSPTAPKAQETPVLAASEASKSLDELYEGLTSKTATPAQQQIQAEGIAAASDLSKGLITKTEFNATMADLKARLDATLSQGAGIPKAGRQPAKSPVLSGRPSEYYKPNISIEEARAEIGKLFTPEEVRVFFDDRLLQDTKNLGYYQPSGRFGSGNLERNALIRLYTEGGKVSDRVAYHEAFHAYFNEFTTAAERRQILDAVRKDKRAFSQFINDRKTYKTADARAEEWLADDFARYLKGPDTYKGLFRNLWEKLLNKIRDIVRRARNLDKLYEDIIKKRRISNAEPTFKSQRKASSGEPPSAESSRPGREEGKVEKSVSSPQGPKTPQPEKQLSLKSSTSDKEYNDVAEKAISQMAKDVKESAGPVKRVVSAMREYKTNILEYVQNTDERVRQLVGRKDVSIDDASDPYLKMTLYPGRVGAKVEAGRADAEAIIKDMKKVADESKRELGSIRKDVSEYLIARHAPERNAALGEKAAGITTTDAKAKIAELEASPEGAKIKALADKAQELNNKTLDILKESGVISDDLYATLREKYKNHVPLQRVMDETDDFAGAISGRGYDVKGTGIKKAVGSERKVADVLSNIVSNYEQAVIRAEKNVVDQATLAFVRKNQDILGDLFTIRRPKAIGKDFEGKPLMEQTQDPQVLQLYENGKRVWIDIKDPQLAIALRGVGREKLGTLLNAVGSFTRLYSGLATRFNPEFAFPNKLRDLQETAIYLASQKGMGFKGAAGAVTKDPASIKDVLAGIRGKDTPGAKLYREMKEQGGTTGGMGLSTRKQVEVDLEKIQRIAQSKTKKVANSLIEYVDAWNTIFEDSTRLSVYKQALSQGLSKQRAAALAKEASINFNRMGKGGPVINALWMFANASIQGSVKMIRALKNPKVLGATFAAVGTAVAAVSEWNDQVDPEWRDKVTKYDRLNGLTVVIPTEDGEKFRYVTIPVSWGVKPIKVMADYAYDSISGAQDFNAKDFTGDTVTSMIEAYNPVGGTDLVSALVPTILDVPVELNRNRSWSGVKIKPDSDPNAPADIRYFDSLEETKTGQAAISLSELLKDKADIAVSPADIKYAFDQYVGGAGRTVSKTANLITGLASDKGVPLDEYPMISRFYRERSKEEIGNASGGRPQELKNILAEQSRARFKTKQSAQELDAELSALPKEEANRRALEIKKEDPELFAKIKDIATARKLGLTGTEKLMMQLGVDNGERAKYIDKEIMKLPTRELRNAYYADLRKKKIISDTVAAQIKKLRANQ